MTPTALLLILLQSFGWTSPDVEPAVQPFYNDILQGFDSFDNLTRVRTDSGFVQITEANQAYQFTWVFQGDTVTGFQPAFNEFTWTCDGSFTIELICYHIPSQTTYSRMIDVYANWSSLGLDPCGENCPLCVSPIWTDYEPYQYAIRPDWDVQPDWIANTGDLIVVLGMQ